MPLPRLTCLSHSPAQTDAIATRLGARLAPGDVLLLSGSVGAGKTHFARALIQSRLRVPEDVPSPTYTLVQTYPVDGTEIWHADLYRLGDVAEIIELGLTDAFDTAICLVEWPDRLGSLAPHGALDLTLTQGAAEEERQLSFDWRDARWDDRLQGLCDG